MQEIEQKLNWLFTQPYFAIPFLIWVMILKGIALWKAAGKRQLIWFIIIMVINTMGLFELAYIFYLNKWDLDKGKLLALLEKKAKKVKK